jgi:hypothetical protein
MGAAEKLPHLFTENEVADYLQISVITLARYRKAGKIGHILIGKTPKYTEHHINAYLEAQQCNVSSSGATGSSGEKGPRTGSARGETTGASSNALLLAHQILNKPRST